MKLASYNIRKAVGRDRRRDPGRVIEVIISLGADIVVLQEADRRLGPRPAALPARMIAEHTDLIPAPLAVNDVSLGWHGNAVLVRRGLAVTDVARFELPSLEPRGAVSVEIEGRFRVTGAHLALMRRYRHQQLRELHRVLKPHDLPMVVTGDFNEWSLRRGMEELSRGFHLHAPGASYPTMRPVAHLDRFALSHDLELTRSGVLASEIARMASDHLPVWAEVSVSDAGAAALPQAAEPAPLGRG
ncbi:endonuclease/exonuclease/phosphatase family protein [Maritimibacter sp. UBA3975]|uniref:endonuclease/exonuclease/phosphatase family protein n=1 Tax=Maritimibacter sp. UBA3975 TaxID=1946833 RepID=UPI000C0AD6A8|nr:endonuclease/exonuclease/phosphatase family protein [Maritimibacter sp. UBA3975]MAM60188.1 metal-dependent hydrolase [Maritimibacter sp.]